MTNEKVGEILKEYGKGIGIENIAEANERCKNKKYCMLIFLKSPKKIEPFRINKKGFGMMIAWISVSKISDIKIS